MFNRLKNLLRDKRAATAVEYGVILSMIVLAMIVGLNNLGRATSSQWNYVSTQVSSGIAQANA